jgi:hypothetical protein
MARAEARLAAGEDDRDASWKLGTGICCGGVVRRFDSSGVHYQWHDGRELLREKTAHAGKLDPYSPSLAKLVPYLLLSTLPPAFAPLKRGLNVSIALSNY